MDEGSTQLFEDQPQSITDDDATPQPEHIHAPTAPSENITGTDSTRALSPATDRPLPNLPSEARLVFSHHPLENTQRVPSPLRVRGGDGHVRMPSRHQTMASTVGLPTAPLNASGIDWIVPVNEKASLRRTVGERLQPTIENAAKERDKYARKALLTGYALNIAIGLQVLLGAMTTAISAAVSTIKQAQIATALLGGLATLVASYLARARGSGEPELSIARTKDLEQFLREARAFQLDHAHEYPAPENGLDGRLEDLRSRFEELLGNASGERKLSPVGITPAEAAV